MIVVTTGSRTWTDESTLKAELQNMYAEFHGELSVVVGYDPWKKTPVGADRMVWKWCNALGIHVTPEPADWSKGGGAGFQRNILMLEKYGPDLVIAFRAAGKSNGTDHCVKEARKRHIPVRMIHERDTRASVASTDDER